MIQVDDTQPTWVGVNTGLPNRVIKLALEQHLIPELANKYSNIRKEVTYGKDKKSRVDFLLSSDRSFGETENNALDAPIYLEVKSATLAQGKMALFPDTVTTRGQKHLRELTALLPKAQAVMLYFINRGDCSHFAPGDNYDWAYGELLRDGIAQGIKVLPCRFEITPRGIRYLGLAEFLPIQPSTVDNTAVSI
jgi:sugar fermentation stimulation protein A